MKLKSTEETREALRQECTETNFFRAFAILDDLNTALAEIEELEDELRTLEYQYGELLDHSRPIEGCEE